MALCQKVVAALLQLTLTFQGSEENIRELSNMHMADITAHYSEVQLTGLDMMAIAPDGNFSSLVIKAVRLESKF